MHEALRRALQPEPLDTQALLACVHARGLANRVLQLAPTHSALPDGRPAAAKGQDADRATAYVSAARPAPCP